MPSPGPKIKHASSLTVLNKMQVCPVIPLQETTLQHRVTSHPHLTPAFVSSEDLIRPIDVIPVVPTYKVPQLKSLISRTQSKEKFREFVETPIRARPELEPGSATEMIHQKSIQVTPVVPIYRSQRETSVASQPALEPGYTSEGEFDQKIDVVPMVPSYKSETERPVPARPTLETGFESKTSLERQLEVEKELTEVILISLYSAALVKLEFIRFFS